MWIQAGFERAAPSPSGSPSFFCLSSGFPSYIRLKPLVSRLSSHSFISPRLPPFLPGTTLRFYPSGSLRAFGALSIFSLATRPPNSSLGLFPKQICRKERGRERAARISDVWEHCAEDWSCIGQIRRRNRSRNNDTHGEKCVASVRSILKARFCATALQIVCVISIGAAIYRQCAEENI